MFIHIGNNNAVLVKDIIAILDKETVDNSQDTKEFVENLIKKNPLQLTNSNNIKSYIIAKSNTKNSKYGIYTSNISSHALYQRVNR